MAALFKIRSKAPDVRSEIERRNELFALPESVIKILDLTDEDNISLEKIAESIGSDPALTGRLIKIANSPFYGLNQRIQSIQSAVMALGMTTVKSLALSASLFNQDRISKDLDIDIKSIYSNIFSVATTCRKLAVACNFHASEEAFICGLLHEIGFIYFLQNYPRQYKTVIERVKNGSEWITEERKALGISHPEAGAIIARQWRLPDHIVSAIENHHSFGYRDSDKLVDIVRLAVALNIDFVLTEKDDFEEKIKKITTFSQRLNINSELLDEIMASSLNEVIQFARTIDIDIGEIDLILSRANKEIFSAYMSIHKLFKERQELTRNILNEERQKGITEAKQIAISTLSHYINNSSMIVSGQAQVLRLMLKHKKPEEITESLGKVLDVIDNAVKKTVAVLEEISELNMLDDVEFFEQSKILNIDDRINERMSKMKNPPFENYTNRY